MYDLAVEAFLALRKHFFSAPGQPVAFHLRDKRNTQDDPLDEYLADVVFGSIPDAKCQKASPLITPDLVLYRPGRIEHQGREQLKDALDTVLAVEVKKLERNKSGSVARSSGLDYNTTPPCGTVRVYDENDHVIDIRSFYLFVCLEEVPEDQDDYIITALAMIDGDAINRDFDLYLAITGQREKKIGIGSYEDGIDRERPMVVFSNPLGWNAINDRATCIHPSLDLEESQSGLTKTHHVVRVAGTDEYTFGCYQAAGDVPTDWTLTTVKEPFPIPANRQRATQQRGKFILPFSI